MAQPAATICGLHFCHACGDLLDESTKLLLTCRVCATDNRLPEAKAKVTTSRPADFPSQLRQARSKAGAQAVDAPVEQMARETCEKCGAEEMAFTTAQLRSADEGTTVFYTCVECGHRSTVNN